MKFRAFKKYAAIFTCTILIANPALAAGTPCVDEQSKGAFEMQALKTEMMLVSITCEKPELYNKVIVRFKSEFIAEEKIVKQWFAKKWGARAVAKHDFYITELANRIGDPWRHELEYCDSPQGEAIFQQLNLLAGVPELKAYASLKSFKQPESVIWCKQ